MTRGPSSVPARPLAELLAEVQTGPFGSALHASEYVGGGVPVINPQHYRSGRIVPDSAVSVDVSTAERLGGYRLRLGDVIIARRGEMGRCAVVGANHTGWVLGTGSAALRTGPDLVPEYLAHFLRSPETVKALNRDSVGSTMANLNQKILLSLRCPTPPLWEQRLVVAAIESQESRIDAAIQTLRVVDAKLKRARASVLKAAVEGRLVPTEAELARAEGRTYEPGSELLTRILADRRATWEATGAKGTYREPVEPELKGEADLPEGWAWASCDQAGDILLGRQRAPQFLTGKHSKPYLRVANIKDDRIDYSDVERMDFDEAHFAKYQLQPGDILVSEGQSLELVGQSAIYGGGHPELCFQKTLHRFRPIPGGPSSKYAQLVFRAWVRGRVFMKRASITTNIAHLTLEKFKATPFALAPFPEQERIVAEVDRRLSVLDKIEATVEANLARCAKLRQSILKRAFEGRLVAPAPALPASVDASKATKKTASQLALFDEEQRA